QHFFPVAEVADKTQLGGTQVGDQRRSGKNSLGEGDVRGLGDIDHRHLYVGAGAELRHQGVQVCPRGAAEESAAGNRKDQLSGSASLRAWIPGVHDDLPVPGDLASLPLICGFPGLDTAWGSDESFFRPFLLPPPGALSSEAFRRSSPMTLRCSSSCASRALLSSAMRARSLRLSCSSRCSSSMRWAMS